MTKPKKYSLEDLERVFKSLNELEKSMLVGGGKEYYFNSTGHGPFIIWFYTFKQQFTTTPSMKSIILTISLCLSICVHAQAQTYISSEEMCDGYMKQYLTKEKLQSLQDFDIVYFVYDEETDTFKKENDDSHYSYMQPCPKLRTACGFTLPPSIFVVTVPLELV